MRSDAAACTGRVRLRGPALVPDGPVLSRQSLPVLPGVRVLPCVSHRPREHGARRVREHHLGRRDAQRVVHGRVVGEVHEREKLGPRLRALVNQRAQHVLDRAVHALDHDAHSRFIAGSKTQGLRDMGVPRGVDDLRSGLAGLNYYRDYVKDFGTRAAVFDDIVCHKIELREAVLSSRKIGRSPLLQRLRHPPLA